MELLERAKAFCLENPPRVLFPDAEDREVLMAARKLFDNKLAFPMLPGGPVELRQLATEFGIRTKGLQIFHPLHRPEYNTYVREYARLRRHRNVSRFDAEERMRQPLYFSAMMMREHKADLCLAGSRSTAAEVLRPGLELLTAKGRQHGVSGYVLLISPEGDRILLFADTAVNPVPRSEDLAEIAVKSVATFSRISPDEPKVALLSFSTRGSAEHELIERIRGGVQILKEKNHGFLYDGEIQFDAAFVPEIARLKAPGSVLKGQANIYIFPTLNAANIGYKIGAHLAGYSAYGPFFQGLNKPYHGLQGGSNAQQIIDTTLMAAYISGNNIKENISTRSH
jgi:phosphotransacetylase